MRKVCVISILTLLFLTLILNFVSSYNGAGGEFGGAGASSIFGINPESGIQLTDKWEYLGTGWKNILMQNAIVKGIDSFLQKLNFAFLVLFGMDYSLSLAFFLTIFLWFFLFVGVWNLLRYTLFSKWVALVISFGLAVGAAQIKLLQMPVNLVIGLFFGEKPWWIKLLIGVGIVTAIVLVLVLEKKFGKQLAENKKKAKDEINRIKLETGAKAGEELSKAVGRK